MISICDIDTRERGSGEASLYGSPDGLRLVESAFRRAAKSDGRIERVGIEPDGPLHPAGLPIEIQRSNGFDQWATTAFGHTTRFYEARKLFHKSEDDDSEASEVGDCQRRKDGGFAVAYPVFAPTPKIMFAGNEAGLWHIAEHLEGMAELEYEPYDPNWPEKNEHYHSWIDKDQDVMLGCGLGIRYGRCDHRKDGSIDWFTDHLPGSRERLNNFIVFLNNTR